MTIFIERISYNFTIFVRYSKYGYVDNIKNNERHNLSPYFYYNELRTKHILLGMLAISLAQTLNVNHQMVAFPPVKYAIRVHVLPAYAVLTHNSCHIDLLRFLQKKKNML